MPGFAHRSPGNPHSLQLLVVEVEPRSSYQTIMYKACLGALVTGLGFRVYCLLVTLASH